METKQLNRLKRLIRSNVKFILNLPDHFTGEYFSCREMGCIITKMFFKDGIFNQNGRSYFELYIKVGGFLSLTHTISLDDVAFLTKQQDRDRKLNAVFALATAPMKKINN